MPIAQYLYLFECGGRKLKKVVVDMKHCDTCEDNLLNDLSHKPNQ
jgi:hypothetical protein